MWIYTGWEKAKGLICRIDRDRTFGREIPVFLVNLFLKTLKKIRNFPVIAKNILQYLFFHNKIRDKRQTI